MTVSSFFAAIMSAHGRDLYSYAPNDSSVVLWAVKKGKEEEKSVRKAIPMARQSSSKTAYESPRIERE